MLKDLVDEAAAYGLDVHETKTMVLWNGHGHGTNKKSISIKDKDFEILGKEAATRYLGRLFRFHSTHDTE